MSEEGNSTSQSDKAKKPVVDSISRKPNNLVVIILSALVILLSVAVVTLSLNKSSAKKDTSINNSSTSMLGKAVNGEIFSYKVEKVDCGIKDVGYSGSDGSAKSSDPVSISNFNAKPKGQFCVVGITLTNTSKSAASFSTNEFYAYDSNGNKVSIDNTATSLNNFKEGKTIASSINSNASAYVQVIYDISQNTAIAKLEVKAPSEKGAVTIKL